MKIKTVIFDLDGTLVNSVVDIAFSANAALKNHNLPIHSTDKYYKFIGSGIRKLVERIIPEDKKNDAELKEALFNEYNEHHNIHFMDNVEVYPGINDLLKKLTYKKIDLAILTNKPDIFAIPLVKKVFPDINFKVVLGNDDKMPVKPDKTATNYILRKLGALPQECVYIGDSDVDVITAKNADIEHMIGVTWGFRGREELRNAGARYIVDSADEIITIIKDIDKE